MKDDNLPTLAPTDASANLVQLFMADGGALGALIGKEAAKALSTLAVGATAIPAAWLAGKASDIQADAAARALVKNALAERVAASVQGSPDFVLRGTDRWAADLMKKQGRRERIIELAAEDLMEAPPTKEEPVSDVFMDRFSQHAEGATSAEMQELFAKVLAGEIRSPGSFSLQSLHVLSIMDVRLARAIENIEPRRLGDFIILGPSVAAGIPLGNLGRLVEVGILQPLGGLSRPYPVVGGKVVISSPDAHGEGYEAIGVTGSNVDLPIVQVTHTGLELFPLAKVTTSSADRRNIASDIGAITKCTAVSFGDVTQLPDGRWHVTRYRGMEDG